MWFTDFTVGDRTDTNTYADCVQGDGDGFCVCLCSVLEWHDC
jgi:hypothetical protein